jgi:hypothetical protein
VRSGATARHRGMDTHSTTSPAPSPAHRRLAALLALVVGLVAVGLGAPPAGAAPPAATPKVVGAVSYDQPGPNGQIRFTFAPPAGSGKITGYGIERWSQAKTQFLSGASVEGPTIDPALTIGEFPDGEPSQFRFRMRNADGWGPWSGYTSLAVTPGKTYHRPFTTELHLIQRQLTDFGIGGPTGFWPAYVKDVPTTAEFLDDLATDAKRDNRYRVIRLYLAYFDRAPEPAGLAYWQQRLDAGTSTVNTASAFFSQSQEFTTTYGDTTNQQFVTLVYQNVLFRQPEADGLVYWTGQLDQGKTTRGKLMTLFSESAEGRAVRHGDAVVSDLFATMLRRTATDAEVELYSPYIEQGGKAGGLALVLLAHPEYVAVVG